MENSVIGRIRGIVLEKNPPLILIEAGGWGIGYEIYMPINCFYKLLEIGKEVIIFTYFLIRDKKQLLFGFNNKRERTLFCDLIKTNGVGPKLALAILSGMSVQEFINAIEQEDLSFFIKLPGIGRKIANRLIIEMKDRLTEINSNSFTSITDSSIVSIMDNVKKEAVSALIALGYTSHEANRMVSKAIRPNISSETLIYEALRAGL